MIPAQQPELTPSLTIDSQATEGTTYKSDLFSTQYTGATDAGFIRGAYHFAQPAASSGASQADYFANNGGGWSGDGITLPGALDIEYNPSGDTCYGLSQSSMVSWIEDFVTTYEGLTGRWPLIYTTLGRYPLPLVGRGMLSSNCGIIRLVDPVHGKLCQLR